MVIRAGTHLKDGLVVTAEMEREQLARRGRARRGIPREVFIGPTTWTVAQDDAALLAARATIGHALASGATELCEQTIVVAPGMHLDQERLALLHEVLHATLQVAGGTGLDDDQQERVVQVLEPWLLMVLRDNPQLVAYLTR